MGDTRPTALEPAYAGPELRAWQRETLAAWVDMDHRGIVESVTGSGKTILGIASAARALDESHRVVVLVRGPHEQQDWLRALESALPRHRVDGPSGMNSTDTDVLVATVHAAAHVKSFLGATKTRPTTLIVDDLYTYGLGTYAQALNEKYTWRLGLTAVVERQDDAVETKVSPFFGKTITGCDYPRAIADGLLPAIRIAQVGVQLSQREATRFHRTEALVEQVMDTLIGTYGAPATPLREFDRYVRSLASERGLEAQYAKKYFELVTERTAILNDCEEKLELVRTIPMSVLESTQSVFFTDRPASAGQVVRILGAAGLEIALNSSGMAREKREDIAQRLHAGTLRAVAEPRVVDAAVEVPMADLSVVLAASRSDRQMLARMGRIIRTSPDRLPVFVVAFVRGTPEDPAQGASDSRLPLLWQISAETITTDVADLGSVLQNWLVHDTDHPAPDTHPTEPELDSATIELEAELRTQGGVATTDELSDLLGLTDPEEMFAVIAASAAVGHLDFRPISDGADELLLLSADLARTSELRRAALTTLTRWASAAADPIEEFHAVIRELGSVRVPAYRLVQIAAFVRDVTPTGLL
ncbi:DEAD/DEAH box helicase [Nocardia macrotermitis]|uniref:Helicase/UvrB N-terminal domain-containing protein n=1 Tax=Nocardia macrotermitis TaxID=2585198 RepID=A0A7K0CX48_9NOCA|nr:DEAD/DEAH box helicase family protein [Nocardia macrotermitis]MQY18087.1 hypothetical protein [Nocardia macrotermitis]